MEKSIHLVKGTYTASEASEILQNLLNEKIRFHNMKSFSMVEKYGIESKESIQRIEELKKASVEVSEMIKTAESYGYKVELNGVVDIKFTIADKQDFELESTGK